MVNEAAVSSATDNASTEGPTGLALAGAGCPLNTAFGNGPSSSQVGVPANLQRLRLRSKFDRLSGQDVAGWVPRGCAAVEARLAGAAAASELEAAVGHALCDVLRC